MLESYNTTNFSFRNVWYACYSVYLVVFVKLLFFSFFFQKTVRSRFQHSRKSVDCFLIEQLIELHCLQMMYVFCSLWLTFNFFFPFACSMYLQTLQFLFTFVGSLCTVVCLFLEYGSLVYFDQHRSFFYYSLC